MKSEKNAQAFMDVVKQKTNYHYHHRINCFTDYIVPTSETAENVTVNLYRIKNGTDEPTKSRNLRSSKKPKKTQTNFTSIKTFTE